MGMKQSRDSLQKVHCAVGKSGFTIIEIIMVIVILSILAVVIVTRSGSYYPAKLNGAGEKLLSDIRYAKRLAMTNHRIYGILFDVPGNSYTVYDYGDPPPAPAEEPFPLPVEDPYRPGNPLTVDYDEDRYYNGIGITSAVFGETNELKFNPFGVPYDGDNAELAANGSVVINYRGNDFAITVIPRTGKVSHEM